MDTFSFRANAQVSQNGPPSSRKRPLSDTSDDETDHEEMKRLRSASILSTSGGTAEGTARVSQEPARSSRDRKKRQKKKKKRKMSVVEESARAEKPPSERRNQASILTRPPSIRPSSAGPASPSATVTRGNTPTAGPSCTVSEPVSVLSQSTKGEEVALGRSSTTLSEESLQESTTTVCLLIFQANPSLTMHIDNETRQGERQSICCILAPSKSRRCRLYFCPVILDRYYRPKYITVSGHF